MRGEIFFKIAGPKLCEVMKFVKIMRKYENKSGFWIRERLKISKIRKYAIMVDRENKEGINRIGVVHILLLQNLNWLNPSPLPSLRDEIKIGKCYNIV